jgi:bacterioferritin-associated ferredoxin
MVVCVCGGVSDREIRTAVAGGAASLDDLADSCRAGQDCGECHGLLLEMLCGDACDECPRRLRLPAGAVARTQGASAERRDFR